MKKRTFVTKYYVYKNETTQKRGTQIRGKNTWKKIGLGKKNCTKKKIHKFEANKIEA